MHALTGRGTALLIALAIVAACDRPKTAAPAPPPATPAAPMAPLPTPTLDRAALIAALDAAAAAHAAGQPADQARLVGRRFALRQAFGCFGPTTAGAAGIAGWSRSRDGRTIEISLTPAEWTNAPVIAGAGEAWETVKGFWLTWPWLAQEACPKGFDLPVGEAPPPGAQSFGLAAVFAKEGSRLDQRLGRPYSFTVRSDNDAPPPPPLAGYRLALEGRLAAFPDGQPVRCRTEAPGARPVCVAAVALDHVAFEDAMGALLSEWRAG